MTEEERKKIIAKITKEIAEILFEKTKVIYPEMNNDDPINFILQVSANLTGNLFSQLCKGDIDQNKKDTIDALSQWFDALKKEYQ